MNYTLTTDHPRSNYGIPVLIRDSDGQVFGPADQLDPSLTSTASDEVNSQFGRYEKYFPGLPRKFLGPVTIDDIVV